MRRPLPVILVIVGAAVAGALALWLRHPAAPGAREHDSPKRLSLHAASPGDVTALNAGPGRSIPEFLRGRLPTAGRPTVLVFLGATCECSRGFAHTLAKIAPFIAPLASVVAVVEGDPADADRFITAKDPLIGRQRRLQMNFTIFFKIFFLSNKHISYVKNIIFQMGFKRSSFF